MNKQAIIAFFNRFVKSIWLFPAILTVLLFTLSALQIHGSSMGSYHNTFYGDGAKDPDLITNKPRPIRSDEWVVTSQKIIGQSNNSYAAVNQNTGSGEDVVLLSDSPYLDWSILFKPHNISFLVLPFDNAYALRWWTLSYLLVLSAYFFVLFLMPRKRLLASLLSAGFLFSPFLQWWYVYGTLASVFYPLFGIVVLFKLIAAKSVRSKILWGLLLTYIAVAFALVLYPPFQIPTALVALAFIVGYFFEKKIKVDRTTFIALGGSAVIAGALVGLFIMQHLSVVNAISSSSYPGKRIVVSGGYDPWHIMSSHSGVMLQSLSRSQKYLIPGVGVTNQSEASNFIYLFPVTVTGAMILLYYAYRSRKRLPYTVLSMLVVLLLFLLWLFVPHISPLGTVTFLDKVPHNRLMIGLGLINLVLLVTLIKAYDETKKKLSIDKSSILSLLLVCIYLVISMYLVTRFPEYTGEKIAILLALPIPLIGFLVARKYFTLAASVLLIFSVGSSAFVHPVYKGTEVLRETKLSVAMREVAGDNNKKWINDNLIFENFAAMNGLPALSGTYLYPQKQLWERFDNANLFVYNRYAHVVFNFDRNDTVVDDKMVLKSPDHFTVDIEPCDPIFTKLGVGYILTTAAFNKQNAPCLELARSVSYPNIHFYIYKFIN